MSNIKDTIYNELCEVLTEYEHPEECSHRVGETELYNMLVKIQNAWDCITQNDD